MATGGRRARVETVCLCKAEREGSDEVTALIQAQCDAWLPWTPSPPSSPVSDQARALALSVNAAGLLPSFLPSPPPLMEAVQPLFLPALTPLLGAVLTFLVVVQPPRCSWTSTAGLNRCR